MELSDDLCSDALDRLLAPRPLRFYPALLSTESDAMAWARAGAPSGAVVVARYQASPRGRSGLYWVVDSEQDVAFSLIWWPRLPERRVGWIYTVATSGLADVVGERAEIEWPDQVYEGEQKRGAVGLQTGQDALGRSWAVINLHLANVSHPRAPWVKRIVEAVERRYSSPDEEVLVDYLPRCRTIGRSLVARLIPLGTSGPRVAGEAVGSVQDGGLVIRTDEGSRIVVLPQSLGILEERSGDPGDETEQLPGL